MPRTRLLISSLIFSPISGLLLLSFLLSIGCTSAVKSERASTSEKIIRKSANQRVYAYPFESVWRATQLALKYPIAVNNMDNGVLESDWIKAADGFQNPESEKEPSAGIRYKILMSLVKGKLEGRESVRVTLTKRMEKQKDFFSEPESMESDGIEEKIIFYRIEREILIEEGLKKAAKN
jgi:hypothetical protein